MVGLLPVVSVSFMGADGKFLPFTLQMYGIPFNEFMEVPCRWVPHMRQALARRGYDPDSVSTNPFLIKRVY